MFNSHKSLALGVLALILLVPQSSSAYTIQEELKDKIIQLQTQVKSLSLQSAQVTTATSSVALKANKSDAPLSFSGKKRVEFTWNTSGVKNCHLLVAGGKDYKVSATGAKKLNVTSNAPYVTLSCSNVATGEAQSDYIYITDPKGRSGLSVITNESKTVTATVNGELKNGVCGSDNFKLGNIAWGDGKIDFAVPELKGASCENKVSDTQTHTYSSSGKYKITFTDWMKRKHTEKVTMN